MIESGTECLLCGAPAGLKHNEYPGYQEPDTFKIYCCPECNTAFSLPEVHTSLIYENIYKNGNKVPGYNRYFRYARLVKKFKSPLDYLAETSEAYWGVREILSGQSTNKRSQKILEIGSGLGYLTYSIKKAGYNITGLDISQTAVDHAKEDFGDNFVCADLLEYAELNEGSFDIVILTEVIEHISKPLEFIKSVMKLLKPHGKALISSPNKSLYPVDIIWATDLPPVHCWWFSEESMKYIAGNLNLKLNFLGFARYYKINFKVISLKNWRSPQLPKAFFNNQGELIGREAKEKSILNQYLQILLIKIPFAYKIYIRSKQSLVSKFEMARALFDKELIICRERGNFFCAIMEKP